MSTQQPVVIDWCVFGSLGGTTVWSDAEQHLKLALNIIPWYTLRRHQQRQRLLDMWVDCMQLQCRQSQHWQTGKTPTRQQGRSDVQAASYASELHEQAASHKT